MDVDQQRIKEAVLGASKAFEGLNFAETLSALTELLAWAVHGFKADETIIGGTDALFPALETKVRARVKTFDEEDQTNFYDGRQTSEGTPTVQ